MEIIVKGIKVLKTGTNDYGEWKLVKVTTEDEEYTTLAKEANLIPNGATINITDMDEDAKGKKFKKFEIVNGDNISQVSGNSPTPKRSERDSSTNDSIEAQVAFKGMVELISTGMVKANTMEYKATIEWAMSRLHSVEQIMATIEEAKGETNKANEGSLESQAKLADRQDSGEAIKTAGDLFNWIISKDKNIKVPRVWLEAEYDVLNGEVLTIKRIGELYSQIKKDKEW